MIKETNTLPKYNRLATNGRDLFFERPDRGGNFGKGIHFRNANKGDIVRIYITFEWSHYLMMCRKVVMGGIKHTKW
jgi:hypothetical protein